MMENTKKAQPTAGDIVAINDETPERQGCRQALECEGVAPTAVATATPASSEADVLLRGLETLEEFYKFGARSSLLAAELRSLEAEANYHAKALGAAQEKAKAVGALLEDLRLVDSIITRHQFKKNALIQILLDLQTAKNWLPRHALNWISRRLCVPMARILEIATFYTAFSLEPQGRHTVQVCMGTACHVRHAPELSAMVSAMLGIRPGETDSRMCFTLKQVNCLGCCALAPVLKIDETYYSNPSLKLLQDIFGRYEQGPVKA